MGYTLHLEDALAEELRQEASAEHISVEELAHRLVRDALERRVAAKHWRTQNQRRLELIAKKMNHPLAAAEEEELRQLQALAYRTAAPFDQALIQAVTDLRQQVQQLPEDPAP